MCNNLLKDSGPAFWQSNYYAEAFWDTVYTLEVFQKKRNFLDKKVNEKSKIWLILSRQTLYSLLINKKVEKKSYCQTEKAKNFCFSQEHD